MVTGTALDIVDEMQRQYFQKKIKQNFGTINKRIN